MKLSEVKELKPLIWTLLDKLVGGDGAVDIDVQHSSEGEDFRVYGHVYSTMPVFSAFNNKPCTMEDASALWIRYTPVTQVGKRIDSLRSFYLMADADDRFTIEKINGVPTMVNV
jgi:hypothetical protein